MSAVFSKNLLLLCLFAITLALTVITSLEGVSVQKKVILHERNFDAKEWDNEANEGKELDPELEQSLHDEEEDPRDPNPSVLRYRKVDYSMDAW